MAELTLDEAEALTSYCPRERIGSGSTGVVYSGTFNGQPCAVKLFNKTDGNAHVRAMQRERDALWNVTHPNIVPLLAFCRHPELTVLVFPLLTKLNAERMCSLTDNDVRTIVFGVARALQYLHSRFIVHRDVKPDNILVTFCPVTGQVERVLLGDLGASSHMEVDETHRTTGPIGTAFFQDPDSLRGVARFEHDVFSLGATLFLLLCGGTVPEFRDGVGANAATLLPRYKPRAPAGLLALLPRMLAPVEGRLSLIGVLTELDQELAAVIAATEVNKPRLEEKVVELRNMYDSALVENAGLQHLVRDLVDDQVRLEHELQIAGRTAPNNSTTADSDGLTA